MVVTGGAAARADRRPETTMKPWLGPQSTVSVTVPPAIRLSPLVVTVLAGLVFGDALLAQVPNGAIPGSTNWIGNLGVWAYAVAPLGMILVSILPIPAEIPAAANGMIFGPVVGTLITWAGAVVGAAISFELARRFGRPLGERYVGADRVRKADEMVRAAGWPGLITLRLIPVVAFTAINWASGLTSVSRWTFLWTTMVGILPGAFVFTWSGTGLAVLYRVNPVAAGGLLGVVLLVGWWTWARYRARAAQAT